MFNRMLYQPLTALLPKNRYHYINRCKDKRESEAKKRVLIHARHATGDVHREEELLNPAVSIHARRVTGDCFA